MTPRNALVMVSILLLVLAQADFAQAQSSTGCGPLRSEGQYGPFDFRKDKAQIQIVMKYHFTSNIEALISGNSGSIGVDLDYTLRAVPNHPNALISMMRLAEREKTTKPNGSRYTVDCWFDRALRFRPDDNVARMIYATYLAKNSQTEQATAQLNRVVSAAEDNPFTHYNAGLVYFDLQVYDKALVQAHRAMALGWPRTELADKLKAVGKWNEPAAETPVSQPEQK